MVGELKKNKQELKEIFMQIIQLLNLCTQILDDSTIFNIIMKKKNCWKNFHNGRFFHIHYFIFHFFFISICIHIITFLHYFSSLIFQMSYVHAFQVYSFPFQWKKKFLCMWKNKKKKTENFTKREEKFFITFFPW